MMSVPDGSVSLVVVRGPGRGRLVAVEGELLVGRLPSNHVVVDAPEVSRLHARLVRTGEGVVVHDLGSRSGTMVNGRRIEAPTLLCDGDELVVGPAALVLTVERSRLG